LGDLLEQVDQTRAAHLALDFARHVPDIERDEIAEPVPAACLEYVEAAHEAIDLGESPRLPEAKERLPELAARWDTDRHVLARGAGLTLDAARVGTERMLGGARPQHSGPLPVRRPPCPSGGGPSAGAARHRDRTRRARRREVTTVSEGDRETGEGLLGIDDPADWDAAFSRGENHLGTAAIGLAFNCSLEEASPRIVRATRLPDAAQRRYAFTAVGTAARLNGALTPELYAVLRAEGPGRRSIAGDAIDDTLTFVPFRELPPWLRRGKAVSKVLDKLETWRLESAHAAGDAWEALRRRR